MTIILPSLQMRFLQLPALMSTSESFQGHLMHASACLKRGEVTRTLSPAARSVDRLSFFSKQGHSCIAAVWYAVSTFDGGLASNRGVVGLQCWAFILWHSRNEELSGIGEMKSTC